MTQAPVYGGPTKAKIIQGAYGYLGQSAVAGYDLDPDEMATGLSHLDDMMAEWLSAYCINLGYNFPNEESIGVGTDESGIPASAVAVVKQQLAMRLAPAIGKQFQPTKFMAEAWQNLRSSYTRVPEMQLNSTTIRGRGARRYGNWRGPFFQPCEPGLDINGNPILPQPGYPIAGS